MKELITFVSTAAWYVTFYYVPCCFLLSKNKNHGVFNIKRQAMSTVFENKGKLYTLSYKYG